MPFTLNFQSTHLSIGSFPTITLPDFTLITGKNGSGKSHLLQALYTGNVKADCAPNQSIHNQNEIRLFDWNTMVPQDTGMFSSETIKGERQNFLQQIVNARSNNAWIEHIRQVARSIGLDQSYINDISRLSSITIEEVKSVVFDENIASIHFQNIRNAITNAENNIFAQYDEPTRYMLRSIGGRTGKSLLSLSEKDIFETTIPSWGHANLFQQSFARLFVSYRDAFLRNRLAKLRDEEEGTNDFLDKNAFKEKFGPSPWEFVNTSLANAGLDFEINSPYMLDYVPYEPKLTKKSSGAQISFQHLSSGEKILMSFAFCVYYSQDRRQITVHPKIILLDEIDAPLHPSMSRGMIETIRNTLVGNFDIKVISTSHSPSTVAMAEEDAIFVMHSDGTGLHKTSKATALNILTEGVPTLSVSFSGRKQVFVESPADAQTYTDLYKIIKSRLNSECSLEFISTGTRSKTGQEENTGCDVVKRLVSSLSESGNTTVFGLLDWDQKNDPSDRIFVVAHGSRDGLENIILDPLMLSALICSDFKEYRSLIGITDDVSYLDFLNMNRDQLQKIAENIGVYIFESSASQTAKSSYTGGLVLQIDERFLLTDDHAFESLVLKKFPGFKSIVRQNGAGVLMQYIINKIMMDKKDFVPKEISDIFKNILSTPAHIENPR